MPLRFDENRSRFLRPDWCNVPVGPVLFTVLVLAAVHPGTPAAAQVLRHGAPSSSVTDSGGLLQLDVQLLHRVYDSPSPAFRTSMRAFDRSAMPIFLAVPSVAWVLDSNMDRGQSEWRFSTRLAISQAITFGSASLVKRLVGRSRPYAALATIASRQRGSVKLDDRRSFPSGHTVMAFSLVSTLALNADSWAIRAPILVWAAGVSLSRVWLGVHYPSDIIAGALLGASIAVIVHVVDGALGSPDRTTGSTTDAVTDSLTLLQSRRRVVVLRASIGG